MSAKMRCPGCELYLKEEGDNMKQAQGEYKVLDAGGHRFIKCLKCGVIKTVSNWSNHQLKELKSIR